MSSRPRWPGRTQKFNWRHVQRRNQDELRQELHTTKMIHMMWEETWIGSSFAGFSQQEHLPAFQKLFLHRRHKKEHGSWLLLLLARSGGDWSLGWCEYKGSTLGDIWVDLCWDSSTGFFQQDQAALVYNKEVCRSLLTPVPLWALGWILNCLLCLKRLCSLGHIFFLVSRPLTVCIRLSDHVRSFFCFCTTEINRADDQMCSQSLAVGLCAHRAGAC